MRVVAVLGGGLMGSGIATALVLNGIEVVLKEVNQQFLDVGAARTGWRACRVAIGVVRPSAGAAPPLERGASARVQGRLLVGGAG